MKKLTAFDRTVIATLLFIGLIGFSVDGFSKKMPESYYAKIDCALEGGKVEYINSDRTRTDCYTPEISIEYNFAGKWYECLNQARHYAWLNKNFAVCKLILLNNNDVNLFARALKFRRHYGDAVFIQAIVPVE